MAIDPLWGTAAAVAGGIAQSALNARESRNMSKFQVQFASDTNVINRAIEKDRYENRLQYAVKDAAAAGLHPLFALGSGGASSFGGGTTIGPTPTGSASGTGLVRAGEAIAQGLSAKAAGKRTTRLDAAASELHSLRVRDAQGKIYLDDLEGMKRVSDLKLAEQQFTYWQHPSGGLSAEGGPESMTFPMGTRQGPPLMKRPLTATSRRSIPAFMEMVGPKGRRNIRNTAIGDELAEVDTAVRPWMDYAQSFRRKFAPSMKNPAAYYYYWKNYYRKKGRK